MARMISLVCPVCSAPHEKTASAVNRSRKIGAPVYCGKECSGIARRKSKTEEQKKEDKRIYDQQYRAINREFILQKKREYHKRTYDPEKAAEDRKKRMHLHVEYCRKPEYKKKKKEYDKVLRAKKHCGEYWESHILALEIRRYVVEKCGGDYEVRYAKGRCSRSQKAKREFAAAKRRFLEVGPMVNIECGQRR